MKDKNTFHASSKYFTICTYTILTITIIAIIIKAIFFWESTSAFISALLSTLSPFLYGILIAFLINPLVNWFYSTFWGNWLHIKNKGLNKALSISFSYILVLAVITLGLIYIIPELLDSLGLLLEQVPIWIDNIIHWLSSLSFFKDTDSAYFETITSAVDSMDSVLQDTISSVITELTTTVVLTGVSIVKFFYDLLVSIIVSCYLLIDKRMQLRSMKRIVYAVIKKEKADALCADVKKAVSVFSGFFDGKMIDSLIIGLLCFICMIIISFFNVSGFAECALLISVIVGVTNMIPYFGPFLGAIPSALLLLIYSPNSTFVFIILIVIIQQLDGNFIGPKILGESTGLRPLWIIFAITVGGWVAGVIGMLLGVPCVAVISKLIEERVNKKLDEKNIDMPIIVNEKIRHEKSDSDKKKTINKKTK